jgi:type I restriction enzyme S subunit
MPEKKKSVVPRLRFPEFLNAEEWIVKLLKHISPSIFDGTHQTPNYTEKGVPFFSVENIVSGNKNKYISMEDYIAATIKNKPEKGDILITRIGNIGFSKVVDWDYEFSIYVTLAVIKKSELFNSQYLNCYFQSEYYQKEILSKSLLDAVPCKINMDELKKTKVLLPSLPEQQKIADCLSSLDKVIDLEAQKLDALKAHKKGLMQQLFPSEGETIPGLRFPKFRDAGGWEVKQLGEVCQMTAGEFVAASKIKEATANNLYPCYGGNGLRGFTETFTHEGIYPLIGRQGALCGNITLATGKFHATEHAVVVAPRKNTVTNWLYYQLVRLNLNQFATGQAQPGLSVANLNGVPVAIPQEEDEQQKIAVCLSSLDEVIDLQTQKLDALKAHKKGLMQQLFPQEVD